LLFVWFNASKRVITFTVDGVVEDEGKAGEVELGECDRPIVETGLLVADGSPLNEAGELESAKVANRVCKEGEIWFEPTGFEGEMLRVATFRVRTSSALPCRPFTAGPDVTASRRFSSWFKLESPGNELD
jgi:hypothetical protein